MADYTAIDSATIEPNAPLISATMFALRDNPIAITEGAAGAPRVQNMALASDAVKQNVIMSSAPGDTIVCHLCQGTAITASTSFGNKNVSGSDTFWATVLVGGRVRVKYRQRAMGGSGSIARLFVNSGNVKSDSIGDGEDVDRVIDIDVNRGDQITLQHVITGTFDGTSRISDAVICASNDSPVVAA